MYINSVSFVLGVQAQTDLFSLSLAGKHKPIHSIFLSTQAHVNPYSLSSVYKCIPILSLFLSTQVHTNSFSFPQRTCKYQFLLFFSTCKCIQIPSLFLSTQACANPYSFSSRIHSRMYQAKPRWMWADKSAVHSCPARYQQQVLVLLQTFLFPYLLWVTQVLLCCHRVVPSKPLSPLRSYFHCCLASRLSPSVCHSRDHRHQRVCYSRDL